MFRLPLERALSVSITAIIASYGFIPDTVVANSQSDVVICASSSSDTDGDGWGWENNRSCIVPSPAVTTESDCIDSDGDGWGWNGVKSCRIEADLTTGECIDSAPLNDGWGWDGVKSCRVVADVTAGECVDSAPLNDGWGWDGVKSCRIAVNTLPDTITSNVDNCAVFGDSNSPGTLAYAIAYSDSTIFINCEEPIPVPEIVVSARLSINGGHLDGGGENRVLNVLSGGSLGLSNIKISGGYAQRGAGILNNGEMNLTSVQVTDNVVADPDGQFSEDVYGAGIYNAGNFDGLGVRIIGNSIDNKLRGRGAGLYNTGVVSGRAIAIANNVITGDAGAGIYNEGEISLNESSITFNRVTGITSALPLVAAGGGGIFNTASGELSFYEVDLSDNYTDGNGGGLFNLGTAGLSKSFINDNKAVGDGLGLNFGGGVSNRGSLVLGALGTINNNISGDIGGGIDNTGDLSLISVGVSGNIAALSGGGIINRGGNVQGEVVSLDGNDAETGGALAVTSGSLSLVGSVIKNNTAQSYAILSCNSGASVNISGNTFSNNVSAEENEIEECF